MKFKTSEQKEAHHLIYLVHRELEQAVGNIPLVAGNLNLQNTCYLTQESSSDKLALYSPLIRSHKWIEKVLEFVACKSLIANWCLKT